MAITEQDSTLNPDYAGLRVLVVEDEDGARIATRRFLQNCGHQVEEAGTVGEALEKAALLRPEVLVCDWKLAGDHDEDGIDVARLLQKEYGVAVIFVTAYALNDLRQELGDLGSVDCLRKPISLHTLAAVVDSVTTATH
jgi:CheY-like chemotaxis protein